MITDWDTADASTRSLSPRQEADLIVALAQARTASARRHRRMCGCVACRVRHIDANLADMRAAVRRSQQAVTA